MQSTTSGTESRWQPYLSGAVFLLPALLIWGFSCVFLFPKLKQIWMHTQFSMPSLQAALSVSDSLAQNIFLVSALVIVVLALLEWRSKFWARYRRLSIFTTVLFLNTAILVITTAMLMSLLLVVPGLLKP